MSLKTTTLHVMTTVKKCTIFCDIDGTLFKYRKFATYKYTVPEYIKSTILKVNNAYEQGHCIILTTARPEYLRIHTLKELDQANIKYHTLIMGIERGTRILINDNEIPARNRAYAFNLTRNEGFIQSDIDLFDKITN